MTMDHENGVSYIALGKSEVKKTISLSDEGCKYLDKLGADVILDFNEAGELIGIELMGFSSLK